MNKFTEAQAARKALQKARSEARHLIDHIIAEVPMVCAWGGQHVTEAFYDADHAAAVRAGVDHSFYAFISGEPYGRWV